LIDEKYRFILGTCYISSSSPTNVCNDHVETIEWVQFEYGRNVIYNIAGGYNLPNVVLSNYETGIVLNGFDSNQTNVI